MLGVQKLYVLLFTTHGKTLRERETESRKIKILHIEGTERGLSFDDIAQGSDMVKFQKSPTIKWERLNKLNRPLHGI